MPTALTDPGKTDRPPTRPLRTVLVDWTQAATAIAALVRSPRHADQAPRAIVGGAVVAITAVRCGGVCSAYPPGTIIRCDDEVWVQAGRGHVILDEVCDGQGQARQPAEMLKNLGLDVGDQFSTVIAAPRTNATAA